MRLPTWGEPAVGEVAGPSACQCGGLGVVYITRHASNARLRGAVGDTYQVAIPCDMCRCVNCRQPCTTGLCELCDAADLYEQDLRRERGR